MKCDGCGNDGAYKLRVREGCCSCDRCDNFRCDNFSTAWAPDVYFKEPYVDPHLIDYRKPEQRNGVLVESRRHKAQLMRELKVIEVGDRRGGCRIEDRYAQRKEAERGH